MAGLKSGGSLDQRFAAAPSTFSGEGVGTDGGFLVPPLFAKDVFTLSQTDDSLLPYTDNIEIESNSMAFPKDETTPWGTDGVRAYWQSEAGSATVTKAKMGLAELRMRKLMALVPVTDELLQDATALGGYLPGKMADSIRWKTNEAFFFGTGAGLPQGAFSSAAVVTVPKDAGQATLTLSALNLANMIARLPAGSYPRAVWMMNNDVLPSLFTMTLGNYPIYIPASEGAKFNPYGTLLGRPIMVTQHAKSFTNQGDVMLADWKYYRTITKADGIQMATSLHLYFDADATAFRATFRVDGQSKIAASITPANGSKNLSPFVQLAAR
jgi:HK97 family phage major capsid protein